MNSVLLSICFGVCLSMAAQQSDPANPSPGSTANQGPVQASNTVSLAADTRYQWHAAAGIPNSLSFFPASQYLQIPLVTSNVEVPVPITQDFIPLGRGNRPGYFLTVNYLTIHDTDNPSWGANAAAHASYVKGDSAAGRPASWHFTVDDHEIYQHLPVTESGWHAGDGTYGTGNRQSLGIEICMNSDGNRSQAEENAAWLTAKLAIEHKRSLSQIKQHYDWSGKNCPSVLRGRAGGWTGFLNRVEYYMTHPTTKPPSTPTAPMPGFSATPGPVQASSTVMLSWSASAGATYYDLGVKDMVTGKLVVDVQTVLTTHTTTLDPDKIYRWNVAAANSTGRSRFTSVRYFQTPAGTSIGGTFVPINQDFILLGRNNRPAYPLTVSYLTIHDTGNSESGANAAWHAEYVKGDTSAAIPASWHFTVDDHEVYQHLPVTENGWHAGDGGSGTGNRQSLGIEICMNRDGDRAQAEDNAAWLVAKLANDHNLSRNCIKQHYDWSGKNCPIVLRGRAGGWNRFLDRVEYYMTYSTALPFNITSCKLSGSTLIFELRSVVGATYVLEYKHNLSDSMWIPLQTKSGDGGIIVFTDSEPTDTMRFYRVRRK